MYVCACMHICICIYIWMCWWLQQAQLNHYQLLWHPYISPVDVRPSNGFGSLAYNKDATVVVPAVAAVGRSPPIVRKLHYVFSHCVCMLFLFGWPPCQRSDVTLMEVSQHASAVRCDLNRGLPTCIRFIIYQEYMVIVYYYVFCKPDMVSVSILVE